MSTMFKPLTVKMLSEVLFDSAVTNNVIEYFATVPSAATTVTVTVLLPSLRLLPPVMVSLAAGSLASA